MSQQPSSGGPSKVFVVQVKHDGKLRSIAVQPGYSPDALHSLLQAVFEVNPKLPILGFIGQNDLVIPLAVACQNPEILVNMSWSLIVSKDKEDIPSSPPSSPPSSIGTSGSNNNNNKQLNNSGGGAQSELADEIESRASKALNDANAVLAWASSRSRAQTEARSGAIRGEYGHGGSSNGVNVDNDGDDDASGGSADKDEYTLQFEYIVFSMLQNNTISSSDAAILLQLIHDGNQLVHAAFELYLADSKMEDLQQTLRDCVKLESRKRAVEFKERQYEVQEFASRLNSRSGNAYANNSSSSSSSSSSQTASGGGSGSAYVKSPEKPVPPNNPKVSPPKQPPVPPAAHRAYEQTAEDRYNDTSAVAPASTSVNKTAIIEGKTKLLESSILILLKRKTISEAEAESLIKKIGSGDEFVNLAIDKLAMDKNIESFLESITLYASYDSSKKSSPTGDNDDAGDEEDEDDEEDDDDDDNGDDFSGSDGSNTHNDESMVIRIASRQAIFDLKDKNVISTEGASALLTLLHNWDPRILAAYKKYKATLNREEFCKSLEAMAAAELANSSRRNASFDRADKDARDWLNDSRDPDGSEEEDSEEDDDDEDDEDDDEKEEEDAEDDEVDSFDREPVSSSMSEADQKTAIKLLRDAGAINDVQLQYLSYLVENGNSTIDSLFFDYENTRDANTLVTMFKSVCQLGIEKFTNIYGGDDFIEEEESDNEGEEDEEQPSSSLKTPSSFSFSSSSTSSASAGGGGGVQQKLHSNQEITSRFESVIANMGLSEIEVSALRVALASRNPAVQSALENFKLDLNETALKQRLRDVSRQVILNCLEENGIDYFDKHVIGGASRSDKVSLEKEESEEEEDEDEDEEESDEDNKEASESSAFNYDEDFDAYMKSFRKRYSLDKDDENANDDANASGDDDDDDEDDEEDLDSRNEDSDYGDEDDDEYFDKQFKGLGDYKFDYSKYGVPNPAPTSSSSYSSSAAGGGKPAAAASAYSSHITSSTSNNKPAPTITTTSSRFMPSADNTAASKPLSKPIVVNNDDYDDDDDDDDNDEDESDDDEDESDDDDLGGPLTPQESRVKLFPVLIDELVGEGFVSKSEGILLQKEFNNGSAVIRSAMDKFDDDSDMQALVDVFQRVLISMPE